MFALKTAVIAVIMGNCACDFLTNPGLCEVRFRTESGWVCGRVRTAEKLYKYASFRGVPYGKSPLGKLRFEELQDVEPWSGVLDAREESLACPQKELIYGRMAYGTQSEDCIYLNLHVPIENFPKPKPYPDCERTGLPILVMIHGGGFQVGSGLTDMHGPEYLIIKKVIVITFNYRINVFGFLSLATKKIPGNQALRDVIKLLKWVQRHACAFGGDPNNVTLMGQSAGATIAHLMTLSKATTGLFHKVYLMSGTAIPNYFSTSPEFAKQIANSFLQYLGINSTDPDYIHNQLIKACIIDIMYANALVQYDYGLTSFVPVMEQEYPGVTRVLDADPLDLIAQGRGFEYPLVLGYTDQEMQFFKWVSYAYQLPQRIKNNPSIAIPLRMGNQKDVCLKKVIKRYFQDNYDMEGFINYYNYAFFKYPALKLAELRSLGGAPTYLYRFSYNLEKSCVAEGLWTPYTGAAHVDDLTLVFRVNSVLKDHLSFPPTNKDDQMKSWMVTILTNFMKCSNPTCTRDEVKWPPLSPGQLQYQDIAVPMQYRMKTLDDDEMDNKLFFDDIDEHICNIEAELKRNVSRWN